MISSESSDLFEVTCMDCNSTKSYFTAQGVSYFKASHVGHRVIVKEPGSGSGHEAEVKPQMAPVRAEVRPRRVETPPKRVEVPVEAPVAKPAVVSAGSRKPLSDKYVRVSSLVVDVVDEEKGRKVKVYGIAGGLEKFTKEFDISHLADLNYFLESGNYADAETGSKYAWTPDKIDLSMDVVSMLDQAPPPVVEKEAEAEPELTQQVVEQVVVENPKPVVEVPAAPVMVPETLVAPQLVEPLSLPDETLRAENAHIQDGDKYQLEGRRVSQVLRKFRWKAEPPYVIGSMFDDLLSIQSQTGMMMSAVLDAVSELGYTFMAIEAPNGVITAWFKRAVPMQTPGPRSSSS